MYQKVEPLTDVIRKRRISFQENILRMKETRLLKILSAASQSCYNSREFPTLVRDSQCSDL